MFSIQRVVTEINSAAGLSGVEKSKIVFTRIMYSKRV